MSSDVKFWSLSLIFAVAFKNEITCIWHCSVTFDWFRIIVSKFIIGEISILVSGFEKNLSKTFSTQNFVYPGK